MNHLFMVDFIIYAERISLRHLNEYIMQSNIAVLPALTGEAAQSFTDALYNARAEITGEELPGQHLDEGGLEALKQRLASESKAIAVK